MPPPSMADFVALDIIAMTAALALAASTRRATPGAGAFVLLMLALAEWSAAHALELATTDLPLQVLWAKCEYAGLVAVPTLWLIFSLQYTGQVRRLRLPVSVLLALAPTATLLLVWTNDFHHLFWDSVGQVSVDALGVFTPTYGPAFWFHSGYSYLLLLAGAGVLLWARVRGRLPSAEVVPRTSDTMLAGMDDAALVLDAHRRIVALNAPAAQLIACGPAMAVGRPVAQFLSPPPNWLEADGAVPAASREVVLPQRGLPRRFELCTVPFGDGHGNGAEQLLILRDITAWKEAEETLRSTHGELEVYRRLTDRLLSNLDVDGTMDLMLRTVIELLPQTEDVYIWLYQSEHLRFLTSLYADGRRDAMIAEPRPEGLSYKVARSGEAMVVPDIRSHPLYAQAPESWRGALAALPLKAGRNVVGVMTVACAEPHDFAPEEMRLLRTLADQVANAIENVRRSGQARPEPAEREPATILPAVVNEEFEARVQQRTAQLTQANAELLYEIQERQRAEQALRESETRYALAARGANDGLWDWDLLTNRVYYSPRWKTMLGCTDGEVGESPDEWFRRVHPRDMEQLTADLTAHIEGRTAHFENEHRMRFSDGNYRWMLSRGIAVQNESGKSVRIAGSQTDISRRKVAEERLLYDALHEPLTGLPNRALFMDRLGHVLRSANRRRQRKAAVLFLDLDRFKVVNDSLGHMVGDQLLIAIAKRLESCVRPNDTVARFGGDEFGILLDEITDGADAERTAQRVLEKLSSAFEVERQVLSINASIGIAMVHRAGATGRLYESPEDILRDADTAMYRAKAQGRARYEVFNASMHARAVELLRMEADLRQALAQQDFELYYQPIVSLATGRVTSVEALVRWRHRQRGLIGPAEFIPLAEETGLIVGLGEWILRSACRQIAAWRAAGRPELRVAVNVSARQFQDHNLVGLIRQTLDESGVPASALEIEITESTTMSDVEQSSRTLAELNELGVQLSIDDFGNSYSTLGYLTRFPFRTLKIDQSFVHDIVHDPTNAAITTAITAMARSLKLRVIAEGIETQEQLAFLRAQQCDEVQGYLLSRPLDSAGLAELLQAMPAASQT